MEDKLFAFNYARNRDKAIANLISIIDGLLADGELNDSEILYLETWLLDSEILQGNKVVSLLIDRLRDILADGKISADEISDLKEFLPLFQRQLMDMPNVDLYSTESDMHLLSGLCKGLIADKYLSESEIRYLDWWITQNAALKNDYPGKELYSLIKEIMADKIITADESAALYNALVLFTGCDLDSGVVDGLATRLPVDQLTDLELQGATFCLTGVFVSGTRAKVSERIVGAGGSVLDNITKKMQYLVIGTGSSRDWMFSSHGRKIEKAINYRDKEGVPLKIIGEETLLEFLPSTR